MMNQVLRTIDITNSRGSFLEVASKIKSDIHLITINSDLFFKSNENWDTYVELKSAKDNVTIGEIKSIHGHDAFLIEFHQLTALLKPIFNTQKTEKKSENHTCCSIRNW
jgi:homoserine O-acetyltransferase